MAAPELTFSITGNKISAVSGFDSITVTFSSDIAYTAFECRATKSGEDWGRGKGALIASFSQTPAGTQRTLRYTTIPAFRRRRIQNFAVRAKRGRQLERQLRIYPAWAVADDENG